MFYVLNIDVILAWILIRDAQIFHQNEIPKLNKQVDSFQHETIEKKECHRWNNFVVQNIVFTRIIYSFIVGIRHINVKSSSKFLIKIVLEPISNYLLCWVMVNG